MMTPAGSTKIRIVHTKFGKGGVIYPIYYILVLQYCEAVKNVISRLLYSDWLTGHE